MAYQARRQATIDEDIELIGKDGNVAKTIHVSFNAEAIAKEYNRCRNEIIRTQAAVKKVKTTESYSAFGKAVVSIFNVVFGEKNTLEILNFYEDNYIEMAMELMPFITDVAAPAIQQAVDSKKQQLANNFKFNRIQRRRLGL